VNSAKENYTLATHGKVTEKHIKELGQRHGPYVLSHLDEKKHKNQLLKFMNLENLSGTKEEPDWEDTIHKFQEYLGSDVGHTRYKKLYGGKQKEHH